MERACVVCCWHRGSSHVKTGFVRRRVRDKYPTGPPQLPSYFLAFCWLCLFVTFRLSFSRTSGKVQGIDINLSHENIFTVSFALIDFIRQCLARGGVLGSSQCSVFFASLRFFNVSTFTTYHRHVSTGFSHAAGFRDSGGSAPGKRRFSSRLRC